jgi:hypothetical protein
MSSTLTEGEITRRFADSEDPAVVTMDGDGGDGDTTDTTDTTDGDTTDTTDGDTTDGDGDGGDA